MESSHVVSYNGLILATDAGRDLATDYDARIHLPILEKYGAAREHRDPSQPGYRLRKIQCISQRTWNRLRLWLREPVAKPEASAPRPPRGEGGGRGALGAKNFRGKIKTVDSGVSHRVKPRCDKRTLCSAIHQQSLLRDD